jgi:hypothetical protein
VGARFSAPVQTGPGAHPVSYAMGTGVSFPGVKRPGRGVDHPPPSSSRVKERVKLYIYFSSRPSWPVLGRTLPLPLSTVIYARAAREPAHNNGCGPLPQKMLDTHALKYVLNTILTILGTIKHIKLWTVSLQKVKKQSTLMKYGA